MDAKTEPYRPILEQKREATAIGLLEEGWIVGIKLNILHLFIALGFPGIDPTQLAPAVWSPTLPLKITW